jgi:hypothetical protein
MLEILSTAFGLLAGASGEQIWAALWPSVVGALLAFGLIVWGAPALRAISASRG